MLGQGDKNKWSSSYLGETYLVQCDRIHICVERDWGHLTQLRERVVVWTAIFLSV